MNYVETVRIRNKVTPADLPMAQEVAPDSAVMAEFDWSGAKPAREMTGAWIDWALMAAAALGFVWFAVAPLFGR